MRRAVRHLPTLVVAFCCGAMLAHGPIPQTANYHAFADETAIFGIANGYDVLSNLGFAIVGMWGLLGLQARRTHPGIAPGWPGYALFLIGLCLTSIGSGYYHLAPDNARLVWDRLPIALACAGLLAGVWGQTALPAGRAAPLTGLLGLYAVASVLWWYFTELKGEGDLRPYLLLQILPIMLIPLWQTIYHSPAADRLWFGAALLLYVLAKLTEANDQAVLAASGMIVSGHTLKHLLATAAAWALVRRLLAASTVTGRPAYPVRRPGSTES